MKLRNAVAVRLHGHAGELELSSYDGTAVATRKAWLNETTRVSKGPGVPGSCDETSRQT